MRLLLLFAGLAVAVLLPFIVWGEGLEALLDGRQGVIWLQGYGAWAWLVALALLVGDIFLPVPATAVMAALGIIYGPLAGGLIAALGSFLAGSIGYGLCRALGQPAARAILGEADLARGEKLVGRIGGWLVALSRALPLLPEVITCMAGLLRMAPGRFHAALACGSLPMGLGMAWLGHVGIDWPLSTMLLAMLLPAALWLVVRRLPVLQLDD